MITTEMAGVLSRASKRLLNKLPQFERYTIQRAACKVKEDIALRLAESFETALNLAEGLVVISYMDGEQPDHIKTVKTIDTAGDIYR